MTFKKIHRRADLPQFQDLQARAAATSETVVGGTTYRGPSVIEPTGPPIVNGASSSSAAAAAGTTTTSNTSSASSAAAVTTTTSVTSAAAATTTTVPTTPPAGTTIASAQPSRAPAVVVTTTHTSRVTVSASSGAASATTTSSDSSGMGLGSIAGIAVAAIIAIGVGTAFIIWLIRRRNKNHDIDEEPFNRNSFLRNSTAIPDDDAPLPSRIRPTPGPAMSERTPTPLYGQQQGFGADPAGFNYATQPSYGAVPGQPFSPNPFGPGGAPATPLPHSPGFGTAYDQQGFNHGGYQELTRGPGGMHDYPPSPASRGFEPQLENPHSPGYTGHESFPMPPANVAGGAQFDEHGHEIQHRSMTPAQHGQVVSVRNSLHNGRETPVQLGFAPAPHAGAPGAPAPAHGRAPGQRPETVYDDEDAYGGI